MPSEETEGFESLDVSLETLQARLSAAEETNKRLASIVSDPDVAALVQAKDENRSVRLVVGGEADASSPPPFSMPDELELDGMTNTQLAAVLSRQGQQSMSETLKASGIVDKLSAIEAQLSASRSVGIEAQARDLQKLYPDFLEYKDGIVELAKSGLSLEESYLVSRARSGKGLPSKPVATEKPTSVTISPAPKVTPARAGPQGFAQDLAETLERLQVPGNS